MGDHKYVSITRHDDPRTRERTVPMQVLSLGYSRTGTMTMQAALEILGIPTWHNVTMAQNEGDMSLWIEALKRKYEGKEKLKREDFDRLLGHWGACTDQPACVFAEELAEAYPETKIILVERDVERWYNSFNRVVIGGSTNFLIPIITKFDRTFIGGFAAQNDILARYVFGVSEPRERYGILNNPKFFASWRANARKGYQNHIAAVKQCCEPDRLLSFKFEEGWEPLCRFLGKDVPDVPFPRVNESKAGEEMVKAFIAEGYKRRAIHFMKRWGWLIVVLTSFLMFSKLSQFR